MTSSDKNGVWGIRAVFLSRLAAFFTLGLAAAAPAYAADDISLADLKAATRSLGFLQNLPHSATIKIGIVYLPGVAVSKALAQRTADRLHSLPGPENAVLEADLISIQDLANSTDGLAALYLLPGTMGSTIPDVARRKHLLVMSNDPACLDQRCCILMARDTGRVEIVLDSALADSAGVSFSSIFAMMVKHR